MRKVDNNRITLTKGDTLSFKVNLKYKSDGSDYVYKDGDSIRFAISEGYVDDLNYHLIYEQSFPADTLTLTMPSSETEALRCKTYNYDIQLTLADGTVDTVISSQLDITGEVS